MSENPTSLLLFGSNGQVGREITEAAGTKSAINLTSVPRDIADLSVPGRATAIILNEKPDCIINAAAYTAVDKAQTDQVRAWRLNADAAEEIAIAAEKIGARLIHLSTDYVFPGTEHKLLDENDFVDPLNYYGTSKRAGEIKVRKACPRAIIIRTSWVFSAHGQNFVKTMLRLAQTKSRLSVVNDQIGGPTSAHAIAVACLDIVRLKKTSPGIFHFQGTPTCSWADFASAIFEISGNDIAVHAIPTKDYPTPAKRPLVTTLNCSAIKNAFGIAQPNWQHDLIQTIETLNRDMNDKR